MIVKKGILAMDIRYYDIKYLRKKTGMTQQEFANYFGMSKRTIQEWEGGRNKCADYLLDLIIYKLQKEGLIKS